MSLAPVSTPSHTSLYAEHMPHGGKRSLTDTANVKVGETSLGKFLVSARDMLRQGEIIYLEFIPCSRVFQESTMNTFRKKDDLHLESIGAIRFINHSAKPNAQIHFPVAYLKNNGGGHFIGLEVIRPITKGEEITCSCSKTRVGSVAAPFIDKTTGTPVI